jgi:hypothetical protein
MDYELVKKSAIFGLTFHGRQFVRRFINEDLKLVAILDNDSEKVGSKFCNLPIILPETSILFEIEQYFVVGRYALEHEQQLIKLGIPQNAIKHVSRSEIAINGVALIQRDRLTKSFLKTISDVCDSNNHIVWLDSSGLLAAARNEAIGGLSDVDLLLTIGSMENFAHDLKKARSDWTVEISMDAKNPTASSQIVVMSSKLTEEISEPAIIDIRGSNLNPKLLANPHLLTLHFQEHSKYLDGTSIRFPSCHEIYLEALYGPNWQVPDQFYRPKD